MGNKTKNSVMGIIALAFLFSLFRGGFSKTIFASSGNSDSLLVYSFYGIALVVCAVVLLSSEKLIISILNKPATTIITMLLGILGVALCIYADEPLACVGAILVALFLSAFMVLWADTLSRFSLRRMFLCAAIAYLLSFIPNFISRLPGNIEEIQMLLIPLVIGIARLVCGPTPEKYQTTLLQGSKGLPWRFAITMVIFIILGNVFRGITDAFSQYSSIVSIYYMTAANLCIGLVLILLLIFRIKEQRILFWSWLIFSLSFFIGIFLTAFPGGGLLNTGTEIIAISRVGIDYLLFLWILMVIYKAKMYPTGIVGALFLLPLGISVLLRYVAIPIAAEYFGEMLLEFFPIIALAVGFLLLFSQYAFVGKSLFDSFFAKDSDKGGSDQRTAIIEKVCTDKNLTEREIAVAHYIAQGYSLNKTADLLVISPNTVRTHSRAIYRKLDIHSRQEFIDLIDSFVETT